MGQSLELRNPPPPGEYLAMGEEEREKEFERSLVRLRAIMRWVIDGREEENE